MQMHIYGSTPRLYVNSCLFSGSICRGLKPNDSYQCQHHIPVTQNNVKVHNHQPLLDYTCCVVVLQLVKVQRVSKNSIHVLYSDITLYYWYWNYSKMLPSANALCVRLGGLLVCSMWKCRIQVLQRTMTSQTMCWCLAYSPLAVHDLAKEGLNKPLRLVTRHSNSKSAGSGRSQYTASQKELFCGWANRLSFAIESGKCQGNHRSCLDLNGFVLDSC